VFVRLLCRLFGHHRCRRNAHRINGNWHSRCKRCGTKLVRVSPSNWREQGDVASGYFARV